MRASSSKQEQQNEVRRGRSSTSSCRLWLLCSCSYYYCRCADVSTHCIWTFEHIAHLVFTLTLLLIIQSFDIGASQSSSFDTKPRIRREWRTLSPETRQKVADAFRVLKTTTTEEGRALYNSELFWNLDDLTMLHACSTVDPRCDQGHVGPHFMTFHRAYLLRLENALLAVDPSILALPYWDYSRDTKSGDCFEKECYIFSDAFFGDIQGNADENYAVTNGLFANWPITEYSSDRFGAASNLNVPCTINEYFKGFVSTVCTRCCGKDDTCICDQVDDVFPHYLRNHDDCTPYVARNPGESLPIMGTYNLLGTKADFDACTNPSNVRSHMEWQNCIEFEQFSCLLYLRGIDCEETLDSIANSLPPPFSSDFTKEKFCAETECTLEGFYRGGKSGKKERVQPIHTQAHLRIARDIQDVATSPNDIAVFPGYHANIDRSHMTWMMNTYSKLSQVNWAYPASQDEWVIQNFDRLSGPWSTQNALTCGTNSETYPDYSPFQSAWLPGTLAGDTCNAAFPFDDLWDQPPQNGVGYTHEEILYYSDPRRTVYTYDTLAKYYCKSQNAECTLTSDCCDGLLCKKASKKGGKTRCSK